MVEKILVVDDEEDLAELISWNLERNGFEPVLAHTGRVVLELAREHKPALIILDLMLPDVDGLEVFRQLRGDEELATVPVVMLTAKADELDRIVGLELGADDYVTKPFSPRELVLRIRSILRRTAAAARGADIPAVIEFGPVRLVPERFEVFVEGEKVVLTSTEYKLLQELVLRRGKVLNRRYLLENVWGYVDNVTDRTVDTHIKRLRQKVGPNAADYIETIRGVGYRFLDGPPSEVAVAVSADEEDDLLM